MISSNDRRVRWVQTRAIFGKTKAEEKRKCSTVLAKDCQITVGNDYVKNRSSQGIPVKNHSSEGLLHYYYTYSLPYTVYTTVNNAIR